ncbi:MAG TPA: phosphatase PAP2 family protein [Longimicrobium sp.]|nr:phosphatase PAP2 family protein [Longimicrobium sp.]
MDGILTLLFGTEPIQWIQHFFGLGHPLPFRIFSLLGDTWGMILIVGVASWLFGQERLHAAAAVVATGAAAKVLLSSVFQQERPRGEGIVVYERLEVSSFPSGHVFEAVGPWGLLFALGCISFGLAALVVALVGLGRLYLGAHFLGDVVGGVVFGVAFVWLFSRGWPGTRRWLGRRPAGFYTAAAAGAAAGSTAWMLLVGGGPRRWEVAGIVMGGALALVLEHRCLAYAPGRDSRARMAAKVVVGLAPIAAMLLLDRGFPEDARLPGLFTAGFATLWAIAGAPVLFAWLGWGMLDACSRRGVALTSRRR